MNPSAAARTTWQNPGDVRLIPVDAEQTARDGSDLADDVLLQICRVSANDPQVTPEWLSRMRQVTQLLVEPRLCQHARLEAVMTLLAAALGQLTQFNPTHLPFGYEGTEMQSRDWMERRALERVGKQVVGLMWRHTSAEGVAVAVERAVSESIRLGFLEQRQYDAWRPGMRSGSGWRWAVTATPYGVMKACSVTGPRLDATTTPTETTAPHGVETFQRTPGREGGKIGESFVEPTPVPEAIVNHSAPTRPTDASDGQPEPGDASGSASVPTNGEAHGENPIGAWLSACRQLEDARLIGEYAQATPESLLAQCNRLIECIAGFDTVFLCSPAQAEQQAKLLDNDWLVGFKRVLEILLLAAVSRKIDLGRFKELASTAYSLWTGLLDRTAATEALQGLFSPGIAQLFDLKRALMVELAQVSGECSTSDPLVVAAAARTPAGQGPECSCGPVVQLGPPGRPCVVLGKQVKPLTDAQYAVVSALLNAGDEGLNKDGLEAVRASARRILKRLRQDADWAEGVLLPGQTNGRYRIRTRTSLTSERDSLRGVSTDAPNLSAKGVRIGLGCGLLRESSGSIELAPGLIKSLCHESREWSGKGGDKFLECGWQEFIIVAALKAKDRSFLVYEEDFSHLLRDISLPLTRYLVALGCHIRLLSLGTDEVIRLAPDVEEELWEMSFLISKQRRDLRRSLLKCYADLATARLVLSAKEKTDHCHLLSFFVFQLFEEHHRTLIEAALSHVGGSVGLRSRS